MNAGTLNLDDVTAKLERNGVKIHTLSRYYLGPRSASGLIYGYGAVDLSEIKRGLSALHKALHNNIRRGGT
jgi:DNA-binding transcriptional MocR family regulator